MIATENPEAAAALMSRVRTTKPARDHSRLHVSDLTGCSRLAWWRWNNPDHELTTSEDDQSTLTFMLGEGHHGQVGADPSNTKSKVADDILYTVDEFVRERKDDNGVWQPYPWKYDDDGNEVWDPTPFHDGLTEGRGEERLVVVEYKTTRKSAKKSVADLYRYTDQAGAYCAFEQTPYARLHVFFLVGFYHPPMPVHRCYELTFTEYERSSWRRELLRRKSLILNAPSMESIPLSEHYARDKGDSVDYDCKYCPLYQKVCQGNGGQRTPAFDVSIFE